MEVVKPIILSPLKHFSILLPYLSRFKDRELKIWAHENNLVIYSGKYIYIIVIQSNRPI